jgi:hypothetical protein
VLRTYGAAQTADALISATSGELLMTTTNQDCAVFSFVVAATSVIPEKNPPPITFVPAGQTASADPTSPGATRTVGPVTYETFVGSNPPRGPAGPVGPAGPAGPAGPCWPRSEASARLLMSPSMAGETAARARA